VRHVDELMSSRSAPNGLQVERLEAEGQLPVESPSAVRHVDELMSSRSAPNGLQVERLEAEGQLGLRIICSVYFTQFLNDN